MIIKIKKGVFTNLLICKKYCHFYDFKNKFFTSVEKNQICILLKREYDNDTQIMFSNGEIFHCRFNNEQLFDTFKPLKV